MVKLREKLQVRRAQLKKEADDMDVLIGLIEKLGLGDQEIEDDAESDEQFKQATKGQTLKWLHRDPDRPAAAAAKSGRPTRNLPKTRMANEVSLLLRDRQKPMTRTEIAEALELKGIPVAGVDPSKAIGTILWRMRDEFVNLPGWGYWFIGEEFSPAAYKPPSHQPEGGSGGDDDDDPQPQTALALPKPSIFE